MKNDPSFLQDNVQSPHLGRWLHAASTAAATRLWIVPMVCTLVFGVLLLPWHAYVPVFDSWQYADQCILEATRKSFSFGRLNCFGHPTAGYVSFMLLLQAIDPGGTIGMHLGNWILMTVGLFSFIHIARKVTAYSLHWGEYLLLGLTFCCWPVVFATAIGPNPDFGVMCFYLAYLAALISKKRIAGVIAGTLLVFSKEPGVLIYTATLALYVWFDRPSSKPTLRRLLKLGKGLLPWLIPGLLFAAYLGGRVLLSGSGSKAKGWGPQNGDQLMDMLRLLTSFELSGEYFYANILGLLVSQFAWLLLLPLVAFWLVTVWRAFLRAPFRTLPLQRFLFVTLLVVLVLVTRYRTFLNLRYVVVVFPLFLLSAHSALHAFGLKTKLRTGYLALMVGLATWSSYRTVDPLATDVVFGTFNFGRHRLLHMTSLTGEGVGYGRDQLQYNTQFAELDEAIAQLYRKFDPETQVFSAEGGANWWLNTRFDKETHRRTLRSGKSAGTPRWIYAQELIRAKNPPRTVYYVDFPFIPTTEGLTHLANRYDIGELQIVGFDGYYLKVYELTLRS